MARGTSLAWLSSGDCLFFSRCLFQESFILTCAPEASLLRLVETNFCPKAVVIILITTFRSWIQNCFLKEVPQMICSELDIFLWRLLQGLGPLSSWEVTVMPLQFFPTTRRQVVFSDSWQRRFGKQTKNKRRGKFGTGPLLIHLFKFSVRFRCSCFYFCSLCLRDWFSRLSQTCAGAAGMCTKLAHCCPKDDHVLLLL